MTDYSERVKALRYCMAKKDGITICEPCSYYGKGIECENVLHTDAAAAIEELQAEVMRLNMRCADCEYAASEWPEDPEHTKTPKRGEWIHGREIGKEWAYDHWVTYFEDWRCSNCGVVFEQESKPKYNYCPNCGAKMMETKA